MTGDAPSSIVIHSRRRGTATAFLSPLILVALGVGPMLAIGTVSVVAVVLVVAGAGLGSVSLFDYPLRSVFSASGIVRVCALRHQQLRWDDVVILRRARGSTLTRSAGGLVATVLPRRNYLLVSHAESRAEHQTLVEAMASWAPDVALRLPVPGESVTPTWLHRRRWTPHER